MNRISRSLLLAGMLASLMWHSNTCVADDFPAIVNNEADQDADPMPASEAAASMQLPEGFTAKVFASEPMVQNPIAMAWDDRRRMWIAENFTYSDRTERFDLSMRDRVLILSDTDGDGQADERKVFTDKVQMLTSVEVGRGGVWLMCPPQLLFVPDADGDDVPDSEPQVVLDGFSVAKSNYHNFANGLRWGPDGWLYGRCGHSCPGNLGVPGTPDERRIPMDGGIWRFHPTRKTVEVLSHGTVNPWGHDWNANGELFFINTVIGHVWHLMPGAHFKEPFGQSQNPLVYDRIDMIGDHYHFDTEGKWQDSRDGAANNFGGGHAHIGMMIYQGDRLPERYQNKLFTINMHGMRANVERLTRQGAGYVASHDPDFFVAKDPFFRGLEISTGPDGNVYVMDWSDTGECHEQTGVHRTSGRIFQIRPDNQTPKTKRPFTKPACLAGPGPLPKLWKDYQSGNTTPDQLRSLLKHDDEHIRVWAIRLLTDHWPIDTLHGPLANVRYPNEPTVGTDLLRLASQDSSGLVQLVLASTLQRLPLSTRAAIATKMVQHDQYAGDRDLPMLVWYGLMPLAKSSDDGSLHSLIDVAINSRWPKLTQYISRAVASKIQDKPQSLDRLIAAAKKLPVEQQSSVLLGMSDAMRGWLKAPMPENWNEFASGEAGKLHPEAVRELSLLFGDGRAMDELREIVLSNKTDISARRRALETLIDARPSDLAGLCRRLLDDRSLNAVAARGLAVEGKPESGKLIAQRYRRFQSSDQPAVMELLVSRPVFADALLDQIDDPKNPIPRADLTAFHARQILGMGNPKLSKRLGDVWGVIRDSSSEKRDSIKSYQKQLTIDVLAKADLSAGRALFKKTCAQCHRLFDDGEKIGPGLTGAQRSSLEYLLENILDPSAVVGKDYLMTIVGTDDGRVFNGLVVSKDDKILTLQTQTRLERLPIESIEQTKETTLSPMPDGLLTQLSKQQVGDLIGYLMSPSQVALP